MATGHDAPAFGDLFRTAADDLSRDRRRQIFGKGGDVEREHHLRAHRVDIGHRVCGCDRAVGVGVIDERREEVDRRDDCGTRVDAENGRIVGRAQPHQEVGVLCGIEGIGERRQNLRQGLRARFRRSAAAVGELGEPDFASRHLGIVADGRALGSEGGTRS